jgi:3-isopropylmalate/(R)-2-methylmalate dehydratase large subunit
MGQTMAEKVFSRKVGSPVKAGKYVTASPDRVMSHDFFVLASSKFDSFGIKRIWDPERVVIILDHYIPAPNERKAEGHRKLREMVKRFGITHFHGERDGICHQVMIESGYVRPGDLILGTDSHTCTYGALGAAAAGIGISEMVYVLATGELWFQVPPTIRLRLTGKLPEKVFAKDVSLAIAGRFGTEFAQYRAIEFLGELATAFSIESRLVLSNMSVEFGAKFGFFEVDEKALRYLKSVGIEGEEPFGPDENALYENDFELDVTDLDPLVAVPHSVENIKPVQEIAGEPIHQALLGCCTNGRLEDLRAAAEFLKGKQVAPSVRLLIYPASRKILRQAIEEGLIQTLIDAGGILCPPSCGPCFGDHGGILAPGESCISSTNRNFKGRMGSSEAKVYLASPLTVAASAWKGAIMDPREVS